MNLQTILLCLVLILVSAGPSICVYLKQIQENFDSDGNRQSNPPQIYINKKRNYNKMNRNGRLNGNGIVGYMDPAGNGPVMGNGANGENVSTVVEENVFKSFPERKETTAEKVVKPIINPIFNPIFNKHQSPHQPLSPRPIILSKPQMPIPQPNMSNISVIPANHGQLGFTPDVETAYNKSIPLYSGIEDKYDMQNSIAYWHSSYP